MDYNSRNLLYDTSSRGYETGDNLEVREFEIRPSGPYFPRPRPRPSPGPKPK